MNDKLLIEAQYVMDSYYQDYAQANAFFRIEDFANWLSKAYNKYADETAKEIYKNSLQETGIGAITFSTDWWAKAELDVENKENQLFAKIDFKSIGFTYDNQTSQIQELISSGSKGNCGTYIRTSLTDLWILNNMSKNDTVYWYLDQDVIRFKVNSNCTPKKVSVYYIPSADDKNFKLPSSKAFEIATLAFNFMVTAKKETPFIDETNNTNKNVTPQTEVDTKQTKPVAT